MFEFVLMAVALTAGLVCAWAIWGTFRTMTCTPWIAGAVITLQAAVIGSLLWTREQPEQGVASVDTPTVPVEEHAEEERASAARALAAFGLTRDEGAPVVLGSARQQR
jgi:hypothetical protein